MTEINPENVQDGLDNYPVAFLQHLIDNGEGWKVQSDLARAIMKALEDGTCVLGPSPIATTTTAWSRHAPRWSRAPRAASSTRTGSVPSAASRCWSRPVTGR